MLFEFGRYEIDIDVEKTREFYTTLPTVSQGCSCNACRNYEKAVDFLSEPIWSFFKSLGVDMKKISEVYANYAKEEKTLEYGGFYHLCGRLQKGTSAWVPISNKNDTSTFHLNENLMYRVTNDFKISFQSECELVEDGFPKPVIQMEIEATIPWILDEENEYLIRD